MQCKDSSVLVDFDLVEFWTISAMPFTKLEWLDHWGYSRSEISWSFTHLEKLVLSKVSPTLVFLLREHARREKFSQFSSLLALITTCSYYKFFVIFHPACLMQPARVIGTLEYVCLVFQIKLSGKCHLYICRYKDTWYFCYTFVTKRFHKTTTEVSRSH